MKHLWAWYGLMTISHDDEINWVTVAFCPFSSSPWPQKQQTMMNINFLLVLHVQFSKLPGYYGPTKTTNLSNCSAPITSSTKCHKTADTIQHDPPSVPQGVWFFSGCRCSRQWSADMHENSEYFKSMIYGCCLQNIDSAPKFYIKTKWRITFICMPAKNQRTYIYVYMYIHTVCMIHPIKLSHFYRISPTRNTQWSHIPGLPSQAGHFWVDDVPFLQSFFHG